MLNRVMCILRGGHYDLFARTDDGRLVARCAHCGRESAGWDVSTSRVPVKFAGDANRHRLDVKKVHG